MEAKLHEVDPDGDTILILRKTSKLASAAPDLSESNSAAATVPEIVLEQETGVAVESEVGTEPNTSHSIPAATNGRPEDDEMQQDSSYTIVARFRVSSAHLVLASPYFKAALNGPWVEATPASTGGPRHIYTDDWDEEAFLVVMNIIHCRSRAVPPYVSLEMLTGIAAIVDYYKCYEAMDFFARLWIAQLRSGLHTDISSHRGLCSWLLISWVFRDDNIYKVTTKEASLHATGPIYTLGIPIPQSIIGKQSPECSLGSVANSELQMQSRTIDKNGSRK